MASTTTSGGSVVFARRVSHVHTYKWPGITFNVWLFVMLLASSAILGIFAVFIQIQQQLKLPVPWYFPYYITVTSLVILWLFTLVWLMSQQRLLPAIVMIGAFLLFVLWLVGLIIVSIELWGPGGSVNSVCNIKVFSQSPTGDTPETLAWLQQRNICQSWHVVFAFSLVGVIFLLWIMVMAYEVFVESL